MKRSTKLIWIMAAMATITLGSMARIAQAAQAPPLLATVRLSDARKIALKARPGAITDEELEKERGGSGLRYSFDIKSGTRTYEVGVDAKTGKVLENAPEGKKPD